MLININLKSSHYYVLVMSLAALFFTSSLFAQELSTFQSEEELLKAFEDGNQNRNGGYCCFGGMHGMMLKSSVRTTAAPMADSNGASNSYSKTNVQTDGVDEADIIKTDGDYIYMVVNGHLVIAKNLDAKGLRIVSKIKFDNFTPSDLFIDGDKLLVFGASTHSFPCKTNDDATPQTARRMRPVNYYPRHNSFMSFKAYDIANRKNPVLIKTCDFEGSYLTSRKIGTHVYFVIQSYPRYDKTPKYGSDIIPLYREMLGTNEPSSENLQPIAKWSEIGYIRPIQAESFITVASIDMSNDNTPLQKKTILGSGKNVYASLDHIYIAQTLWPMYFAAGELVENNVQKTIVTKFSLKSGKLDFIAKGEVKGDILNQFAMDESDGHFRIATTIRGYENNQDTSTNNVYVLDQDLQKVGKLEGIAPGESIYAIRFMGKRAYMVTFKHVDPLFVIDLSTPEKPEVLGKLKIPGYSEYLHPYDETHLIGIGKEVDESVDADKIHTEGAVYYTAIQGIKLAIFDVTDVANPLEMHKEVVGDRGSYSEAATEHKAFLFDREKGLLVLPMTVAKLKKGQPKSAEGEFCFQGAYVYDLNLSNGFSLRGKISHYDDDKVYKTAGSYCRGDAAIKRSLYIGDVLYTLSESKLQANDLISLKKLKALELK